jgi:hypothetical protein
MRDNELHTFGIDLTGDDEFSASEMDAMLAEADFDVVYGEEDDVDDEPLCRGCAGSGEGYCDGSRCGSCGGSGVARRRDRDFEFDRADYMYDQFKSVRLLGLERL